MDGRVMVFEGHQADRPEVDEGAHMYDSASGWAFGPLFDSAADCREFLEWVTRDRGEAFELRRQTTAELHALHARWLVETRRAT